PSPESLTPRAEPHLTGAEGGPAPRRRRERHMIAGAELALLRLDMQVVEVHVVTDRLHVLMAQQLLQTGRIAARHQVAHGEGVAENVRRNPPIGEAKAPFEAADDLTDASP